MIRDSAKTKVRGVRMTAFCLEWYFRERGEDPQESGVSWHASRGDVDDFIRQYWETQPDATPNWYLSPTGSCVQEVVTDAKLIAALKASKNGVYVGAKGYLDIEVLTGKKEVKRPTRRNPKRVAPRAKIACA